jgi:hypothetical protein
MWFEWANSYMDLVFIVRNHVFYKKWVVQKIKLIIEKANIKPDRQSNVSTTKLPNLPEMSSIVCSSNFNAKNISVSAPRQLASGAKQAYLSYAGERLMMQTALSMTAPFGLNVADKFGPPEYSVDLSFRGADQRPELKEFMDVMSQLDETLINEGVKNARAWFKADLGREVVKAFYTPSLKYSKDKEGNVLSYPPTIKLKLRKYDNQFETKFYDVNGKPYRDVPIEELLVKGVQVTAIMECAGVWFAGSKFGLTWRAKQIAIHKLPEKMSDFAFRGLGSAVASSSSSASEDNEKENEEVDDEAAFSSSRNVPSVVAALMPQSAPSVAAPSVAAPSVAAPSVAAPSAKSVADPSVAAQSVAAPASDDSSDSVNDEQGDDLEPAPAPRRALIKKKVVPAKK